MKFQSSLLIGLLAFSLPAAMGWGTLGHYTVAYVATNFGKLVSLGFLFLIIVSRV